MLEKTLESRSDCKEIPPVHPIVRKYSGNQSWIFTGTSDAEAETPSLWPCDLKDWLNGKDPDAGRVWGQEEKGATEDERVGWHHRLNGHESEQTPGDGDGQGSLACCGPWGCRFGHDWATELNWTEMYRILCVSYLPVKARKMMADLIKLSFFWTGVPSLQDLKPDLRWSWYNFSRDTVPLLAWWLSGKEPAWQCRTRRRRGFDPWVGKISYRMKWQPTPVFLPGESHRQRSLVGFHPWGCRESDMTEGLRRQAGSEQPFQKPSPQPLPCPPSMQELSSKTPVSGAEKLGDCCWLDVQVRWYVL